MNPKRFIAPAIVVLGTALLLAFYLPGMRPSPSSVSTVSGAPSIGGAFTLVDQRGQTVTDQNLKGKYSLIYFGFTNCPDICPLSLSVMTQALDIAGPMAEDVTPVFVTVDPERDTVQMMADYTANFHPRMVALTGTLGQVRAAAQAWRVYFKKSDEAAPSYTMDHSGYVYLMDRELNYVTHFKSDVTAEQMAARLRQEFAPQR
jgi:protein SCO1/2